MPKKLWHSFRLECLEVSTNYIKKRMSEIKKNSTDQTNHRFACDVTNMERSLKQNNLADCFKTHYANFALFSSAKVVCHLSDQYNLKLLLHDLSVKKYNTIPPCSTSNRG